MYVAWFAMSIRLLFVCMSLGLLWFAMYVAMYVAFNQQEKKPREKDNHRSTITNAF